MMKKAGFGLLALVGMLLLGASAARAQKIVVVDSERVHRESSQGKKILKKIERMKRRKQRAIDSKKAKLKKNYDAIMKSAKTLSGSKDLLKPAVYKQRQEKLQRRYMQWGGKMQQWQAHAMKEQQKLSAKASKMLGVFRTKLQAKIETLSQLKNYTLVVDKSAVWYAKGAIDITDQVIKLIDGR
jgi:Skp family chaperone for outer membrane proteins